MKKYETRDDVPDCIDCDGCGVIGRKPNEWVPFELQCSKCLGTGKDLDALREHREVRKGVRVEPNPWLRIRFYEWVLDRCAPHLGRRVERCKHAPEGEVCCNPKCRGLWGTGCWCCHHASYAVGMDDDAMQEALYQHGDPE